MLKIRNALEHLAQRSRLTKLMPWLYSVTHPSPITIQWVGVSACGQVSFTYAFHHLRGTGITPAASFWFSIEIA